MTGSPVNTPIPTMVVDDEALARSLVAALVRQDPDLQLVAECGDGSGALEAIDSVCPQLVFLDVRMPVLSGTQVAERLGTRSNPPYVIFVTAFDDHAIRAFELDALDYLVKPVQKQRFRAAVERAKAAIRSRALCQLTEQILALGGTEQGAVRTDDPGAHELTLRTGDDIVQLATSDIVWIEAANQYVHLHTATRTYTASESLGQYLKKIRDRRFLRVHRSAVVNAAAVTAVRRRRNGTHQLRLANGEKLVLSRSRAGLVPSILRAARLAGDDG